MNIHSYPGRAKGLRTPCKKASLKLGDFLTALPSTPLIDPSAILNFPMDGNDIVGDCVNAEWDHFRQNITFLLTGTGLNFTQAQIWAFYQTQNPDFDPNGTADTNGPGSSADGGMDIQLFLEYLVANKYILGFASVDWTNELLLRAAIYMGGVMTGVQLQEAQQAQFPVLWDSVPGSPIDGGHGINYIGYNVQADTYDCTSWAKTVPCTYNFIKNQMDECWFPITQVQVDHPGFRNNFDMMGFIKAVYEITSGKILISIPTMELGSSGNNVADLQTVLNKLIGTALVADGKFGKLTNSAVIQFQTQNGLVADGKVGPKTLTKIISLI